MTICFHLFFSFLATISFCVLLNVPTRIFWCCGITGAVSWIIFWLCQQYNFGLGLSNLLAALVIGGLSIFFSKWLRFPSVIMIIPCIVPLVPGYAIFNAAREFILKNFEVGMTNLFTVLSTSIAIAIGFMITNLCERFFKEKEIKRRRLKTIK